MTPIERYALSSVTLDEAVTKWGVSANMKGQPLHSLENIAIVLGNDPVFVGHIWFDEFLGKLLTDGPREWTDADDVGAAIYFHGKLGMRRVTPNTLHDVLNHQCRQHPRHVVRDWLATLVWDGEPRLDQAFEDHWGVDLSETQPAEYVRAASRNFFLGLVARIEHPGCQLDTMVVFEGAQGIGKTSALRTLGGCWYALAHESVTKKDFFEGLQGKWLIEIGELDAFSRAEVTRVKTVISTPTDRYRPSYGRAAADYPRQCVFAGTTNADNWGRDETGLRRFWPIHCGAVTVDTLAAARDQLFAEAYTRIASGESWWAMPGDSTREVQSTRQAEHPWSEIIIPWLIGRADTSITEVLTGALKKDIGSLTMGDKHIVGGILTLAGWEKSNRRVNGKQRKLWVPKEDATSIEG